MQGLFQLLLASPIFNMGLLSFDFYKPLCTYHSRVNPITNICIPLVPEMRAYSLKHLPNLSPQAVYSCSPAIPLDQTYRQVQQKANKK